ncbi:MAG: ABC transporter ATP-binding protein [Chlamydiales bacterium]|nr:ABC transporter ATP-binding protein [Chlamydiales bacterium]
MDTLLKKVVFNRSSLGCFSMLFVQQLLVASSTLWLSLLSDDIESGNNFVFFLILYLTSLVIPYLPEAFSMVFNNTWKQNAYAYLIHRFVETRKEDAVVWNNKTLKEDTMTILTAEGQNTLNMAVDHIYNFMYYFLHIVLNIIAISLLIDAKFAVGYLVSLCFVAILMKVQYKKQTGLAKETQDARIHLGRSLLSSWDNVLLGNKYNFNLWIRKTGAYLGAATRLNLSSAIFNQSLTVIVTIIIFLPSIIVALDALVTDRHNPAILLALLLTLPRMFSILDYTQLGLSYIAQWPVHRTKLDTIETILKPPVTPLDSLENRISWSKLIFTPPLPFPIQALLSYDKQFAESAQVVEGVTVYTHPCGRYTLRADNGAGKSTFLIVVKKHLGEHAFFLPNNHNLSFLANDQSASSGEMLKHQLLEIRNNVDVKVLLLDEWDANLDEGNQQEVSSVIDELSKERLVIEVRHRN